MNLKQQILAANTKDELLTLYAATGRKMRSLDAEIADSKARILANKAKLSQDTQTLNACGDKKRLKRMFNSRMVELTGSEINE
jgi:hypothetical protein